MTCSRNALRRAFTLMEVLVVLAILAALAALVLPRILGSQKQGDIKNAKIQIGMLQEALRGYALDVKTYPSTDQGLGALLSRPDGLADSVTWSGPYIEADDLPTDPWGNSYRYEYPPTHGGGDRPDVWSAGPDGQDDTEDDIVSWSSSGGDSGKTGGTKR